MYYEYKKCSGSLPWTSRNKLSVAAGGRPSWSFLCIIFAVNNKLWYWQRWRRWFCLDHRLLILKRDRLILAHSSFKPLSQAFAFTLLLPSRHLVTAVSPLATHLQTRLYADIQFVPLLRLGNCRRGARGFLLFFGTGQECGKQGGARTLPSLSVRSTFQKSISQTLCAFVVKVMFLLNHSKLRSFKFSDIFSALKNLCSLCLRVIHFWLWNFNMSHWGGLVHMKKNRALCGLYYFFCNSTNLSL